MNEQENQIEEIVDYFETLVSDAEIIGSKFTAGINVDVLKKAISIIKDEEK